MGGAIFKNIAFARELWGVLSLASLRCFSWTPLIRNNPSSLSNTFPALLALWLHRVAGARRNGTRRDGAETGSGSNGIDAGGNSNEGRADTHAIIFVIVSLL